MIKSFKTKLTSDIFNGEDTKRARKFDNTLHSSAARKLDLINAATTLDDLKSPPGNMLEALKGDLEGFHSIRQGETSQWSSTCGHLAQREHGRTQGMAARH